MFLAEGNGQFIRTRSSDRVPWYEAGKEEEQSLVRLLPLFISLSPYTPSMMTAPCTVSFLTSCPVIPSSSQPLLLCQDADKYVLFLTRAKSSDACVGARASSPQASES